MPFPMMHLCIAKKIADAHPEWIDDLPQFYLGNLSPDAVHFRPNYDSEYKKVSHLCVSAEKWGFVTNNQEWIENALSFWKQHTRPENASFMFGYCAHILADIYNNMCVWMPFKERHPYVAEDGYNNIHHKEIGKVDMQLSQQSADREEIWNMLEKSKSVDLLPMISADEIEKIRNNVLYVQYADKTAVDTSSHQWVTYESTLDFIDKASKFAMEARYP